MIKLPQSVKSWKTGLFIQALKDEITKIDINALPLQNACNQGGVINESNLSTTVLHHYDDGNTIFVNLGLFFTEIVPSCSCGDEPLEVNSYCEFKITINKSTARATFTLYDNSNNTTI